MAFRRGEDSDEAFVGAMVIADHLARVRAFIEAKAQQGKKGRRRAG